ncbi:MAG: radical SAM protein [Myxococcaceae bacterium]
MNGPNTNGETQSWSAQGRPVEYVSIKVRTLLRRAAEGDGPWYWAVNPYQGCEFGCTFCSSRLNRTELEDWRAFEQRVRVKANAVEAFHRDVRASDFENRQVVLGTSSEPWQQAEENFRVTRALLEAMATVDGVDLRINTRSSLIARDTDVLRKIARKGRVTVTFSIASLDERVNRLMEPRAPSALRRLAAMEALARSGISVGLVVSPYLPGLDEDELSLETLMTRASNAGVRFGGLVPIQFAPGQRENFLSHVTALYPDAATRFRRIIGRRAMSSEERAELRGRFDALCARLGVEPLHRVAPPRAVERRTPAAQQLTLFSMERLA